MFGYLQKWFPGWICIEGGMVEKYQHLNSEYVIFFDEPRPSKKFPDGGFIFSILKCDLSIYDEIISLNEFKNNREELVKRLKNIIFEYTGISEPATEELQGIEEMLEFGDAIDARDCDTIKKYLDKGYHISGSTSPFVPLGATRRAILQYSSHILKILDMYGDICEYIYVEDIGRAICPPHDDIFKYGLDETYLIEYLKFLLDTIKKHESIEIKSFRGDGYNKCKENILDFLRTDARNICEYDKSQRSIGSINGADMCKFLNSYEFDILTEHNENQLRIPVTE